MFQRTLKLRLYPSKIQRNILFNQLKLCRELYNACLDERRWAWKDKRVSISFKKQRKELPIIKEEFAEYNNIHSQVLQNVIERLNTSFVNFFEGRCKYPRYKGRYKYRSLLYSQQPGFKYCDGYLKLSHIGKIRSFHKQKPLWFNDKCIAKQCIVKWESDDNWYAYIVFSIPAIDRPYFGPKPAAGLDMGITTLVTIDDGTEIENKRFYRKSQNQLARLKRRVSRKQKGGQNRQKSIIKSNKLEHHITNQRKDYLQKWSRTITRNCGLVAVEDNLAGLARGFLAKQVLDAGWGMFKRFLKYKSDEESCSYIEVDKNGTTTDCNRCGFKVPKTLAERIHKCPRCKLEIKRDLNSSIIIKSRGIEKVRVVRTDCAEFTPAEIEPLAASETRLLSSVVEAGRSGL